MGLKGFKAEGLYSLKAKTNQFNLIEHLRETYVSEENDMETFIVYPTLAM